MVVPSSLEPSWRPVSPIPNTSTFPGASRLFLKWTLSASLTEEECAGVCEDHDPCPPHSPHWAWRLRPPDPEVDIVARIQEGLSGNHPFRNLPPDAFLEGSDPESLPVVLKTSAFQVFRTSLDSQPFFFNVS